MIKRQAARTWRPNPIGGSNKGQERDGDPIGGSNKGQERDGGLKHATFLSHGRQPEVNISHARKVVSLRFSN